MWTTRMEWTDKGWQVHLMQDGVEVAIIPLTAWAPLFANNLVQIAACLHRMAADRNTAPPPRPAHDPLLDQPWVTMAQAAELLGLSRSSIYTAAQSGDIETFKVGRLLKVPTKPLRRKLGIDD